MSLRLKLICLCLALGLPPVLFANGTNLHIQAGEGWYHVRNDDRLFLNPFVENRYVANAAEQHAPFFGFGVGYQWDHPVSQLSNLAVKLGLSAYFINTQLTGTNYPFINAGQFDTLNYYVTNRNSSLLVEPTLLYTRFSWQPYVLAGLGAAWNKAQNYHELPSNPLLSAVPMIQAFGNKTNNHFAYEFGLGIQHALFTIQEINHINIFIDYRYIAYGQTKLAVSPIQSTQTAPSLGSLNINLLSVGLEWLIT